MVQFPNFFWFEKKLSSANSFIYHLLDVDQTIAIGDSDNGIITTLYSGTNGVCNPSYQLSSLVRLQNNFVELNLTRDESWYSEMQNPMLHLSDGSNITLQDTGVCIMY